MSLTTASAASEAHVKECFDAWTKGLTMKVAQDSGLYRHLRFSAPGSMDGFDIITWPRRLVLDGGHGSWTFARIEDMFEFFRNSGRGINPHYWSEKLLGGAESSRPLGQAYSEEAYRDAVVQEVGNYIDSYDLDTDQHAALVREVYDELLDKRGWSYPGGHYESARDALRGFRHRIDANRTLSFEDWYEWDLTGWDFHFLFACYSIQAGIRLYDAAKAADEGCSRCDAEHPNDGCADVGCTHNCEAEA